MPIYEKQSSMPVGPAALYAYHARPGALLRLIPPWQGVRVIRNDGRLDVGSRVILETKIGPVWKRWVAEHTACVAGASFTDRQVSGPFAQWTHEHEMRASGEGASDDASVLCDRVDYGLPLGRVGAVLGARYAHREIDRMFAFRHQRTRHDVSRHARFTDRPRLRVAVSGATGAIASSLIPFLTTGGHTVARLTRDGASPPRKDPDREDSDRKRSVSGDISWDARTGAIDEDKLAACDAIVHLAGRDIAVRWTEARRREIVESRALATRKLCERLASMPRRPRTLVCASAVGYYGDRGETGLTEESGPGTGFAAELCEQWEAATAPARDAGIRVVNLRIGVVLAARSGALAKLLLPTRLGLAGPVGSGRQWMPLIAMDDLVGLIHAALMHDDWHGPVNAVTATVRQRDFIQTLGRVLRRPTIAPMPGAVVKGLFGQMGQELLLASANVRPVSRAGFEPLLPTVEMALRFELGR